MGDGEDDDFIGLELGSEVESECAAPPTPEPTVKHDPALVKKLRGVLERNQDDFRNAHARITRVRRKAASQYTAEAAALLNATEDYDQVINSDLEWIETGLDGNTLMTTNLTKAKEQANKDVLAVGRYISALKVLHK